MAQVYYMGHFQCKLSSVHTLFLYVPVTVIEEHSDEFDTPTINSLYDLLQPD